MTETHRFLTFVDALFVAHAEYTQLLAGQKYQIGLNRASAWTSAKIASFNDDSLLDVVGGQARAVDLDVGLGTPDLGLNVTSVRTGLSTDQLEIADVDGDRVNDVLLSSNTSRDSSTLSVLFGRAGSFPNEISSLGTFERVKQTVAAPLAFGLLGEDSAADVGVVTSAFGPAPGRAETDSVSILRSVGGRLPYSLYGLGPVSVQDTTGRVQRVNASPLASTVVRRGKTTDLVAIGRDFPQPGVTTDPFRLWSGALTTDGRPRLAAAVAGSELAIDALLLGGDDSLDFGFNGLLQGIDIDGDGNEEVVGISSDVARTGAAVFVGAPTATGYGTTLAPTVIPVAADGGPFYRVFGLEVVDVDGDSRLDVVALLASAPALGRRRRDRSVRPRRPHRGPRRDPEPERPARPVRRDVAHAAEPDPGDRRGPHLGPERPRARGCHRRTTRATPASTSFRRPRSMRSTRKRVGPSSSAARAASPWPTSPETASTTSWSAQGTA